MTIDASSSTPFKKPIKKGTRVSWKWGNETACAKVLKCFTEPVSRKINGKLIKRKASPEKPAYLLEQEDGQEVLKSSTEIHPA